MFRTAVEEVIHQQFPKVDNLPKEVSNLDAEFYLWESVLPAATVVFFQLCFFLSFPKENNTKFLQLSEKCVEFKTKMKTIEKIIETFKNGSNRKNIIVISSKFQFYYSGSPIH